MFGEEAWCERGYCQRDAQYQRDVAVRQRRIVAVRERGNVRVGKKIVVGERQDHS